MVRRRRPAWGCLAALVFLLTIVAGLIFAGAFYTGERRWSAGVRIGDFTRSHPPLRRALRDCVAVYDAGALATFDATGSYRTSGWFLPVDRWRAVAGCMRSKGWLLTPVRLYSF